MISQTQLSSAIIPNIKFIILDMFNKTNGEYSYGSVFIVRFNVLTFLNSQSVFVSGSVMLALKKSLIHIDIYFNF